jgi:hypothetical protein
LRFVAADAIWQRSEVIVAWSLIGAMTGVFALLGRLFQPNICWA